MNITQELKEIRNRPKIRVEKLFAKNKSIERYNRSNGYTNDTDIHGLSWDERVVLKVGTIDWDTKQCVLTNPINGLEWITKMDKITFCNEDGSKSRFSGR